MSGILFGVGLGPGDPELMTLKAHRLICSAEVIAYPAPDNGESFARRIAASSIPKNAEEIPIVIPMKTERFPAQAIYDEVAKTIASRLDKGQNVVVLCEGDPFFYGSFMYLHGRLSTQYECQIVPGVTAMTTCAAQSARPICARNEVLTVLPGPLSEVELTQRLSREGAFAIMKVGRHLAKLRRVISAKGLEERASYISHASLPEQQVLPLAQAPKKAPYFSMILIAGSDPYAN